MNKKVIRLTEGDLHRIIKKSVNRILRETYYNMNSPEYKQEYDKGLETYWDKENKAQTDKEIADYEALPNKARHPYGADIPDFSNRGSLQKTSDKLASKKTNSVYNQMINKREVEDKYKKALGNPFFRDYAKERNIDLSTYSKDEIVNLYDIFQDNWTEKMGKYLGHGEEYDY